jgi:hypothetical protein
MRVDLCCKTGLGQSAGVAQRRMQLCRRQMPIAIFIQLRECFLQKATAALRTVSQSTHKLVVVVWGWGLPWTPSLSAAALMLGDMHCPAHCLLSGLRQQAQCLTHHAVKARRLSMQLKPTLRRVRCLSVTVWHSTTSARRFILLMPAKASRRATMFTMLAGAALSSSEPSAAAQKHSMRSTNHIQ